jgi:CheY-like chemotaxis protein
VSGDATQLHQVFLNLCVNARDAMPQGGVLTLAAENVQLDEAFVQKAPGAKPGPYVVVQVSDTGTGIPHEILEKIFDPFFTTKGPEHGTGLGLSTVMTIVKSHDGFLQVDTQVDHGTRFRIYLPAVLDAPSQPVEAATHPMFQGQGELVLVVDDEEGVRDITCQILQKHGYRVLTASEGAEAVALYAQKHDEIKVVLTDMMMPFMDGVATIRALQKINPDVKFISASGLGTTPSQIDAAGLKVKAFLRKPFTAEQLLVTLHELLSESDRWQR